LLRALALAYDPAGSEMNAQQIVAVVLATPGASGPWGQERCGVSINGTPSLARVHGALREAGVAAAFLIVDQTASETWSESATRAEAPARLAAWAAGRPILFLCGDLPLLTAATVREFLEAAEASRASRFVEATGAIALFQSTDEATRALVEALHALDRDPHAAPCGDGTWRARHADDLVRLLDLADYAAISRLARLRKAAALAEGGALVVDPEQTYVEDAVTIGAGTTVHPNSHLIGDTAVGRGCTIGPDVWIEASVIEDGARVWYSVVEGARVRAASKIGPFAHLRPHSDVGPGARVGNFVEVKASRLGAGVKAGHLAYLGDAEIGAGTNVGAGAVTCNYDGRAKHRTVIGEEAFVGTNVSLVAPVKVGDRAFLAAGSTITDDVPPGELAIARARQVNKERQQA
jgi:bifunctional N-acetylglucosamine-1-phosphate-uridyltransferase/glucosamine-1-phosphate-acetyltransferase GlmU-like protein